MLPLIVPILPNSAIHSGEVSIEGKFELKVLKNNGLVQNKGYDESKVEFNTRYYNDQSNSLVFKDHLERVYQIIQERVPVGSTIVDVGCGQGALIEKIVSKGRFKCLGFDKAYNGNSPLVKKRFLNKTDKVFADLVVVRHVLDCLENPYEFLELIAEVFPENALIFIEVPQFENIRKNNDLLDFSYERISYFTTDSLNSLFSSTLAFGNFFGGQYQFCVAQLKHLTNKKWEEFENPKSWTSFDFKPYKNKFMVALKKVEAKKRIWIWGGGNRGVMFSQYAKMFSQADLSKIIGVVDINENKQGKRTPSTNLAIYSPEYFFTHAENDDAIFVVNPNYFEEVSNFLGLNLAKRIEIISF